MQGVDGVTASMVNQPVAPSTPPVNRLLRIQTPFGGPVSWAAVGMVTDIGDSHALNDDRCLVLTSSDLGKRATASNDFMLCLLADGATGSTFGARAAVHSGTWQKQAGWRASQLAQSAFVQRFLRNAEVDVLDRLKEGLRAADRALTRSTEGTLSATLVALYLSADGTAYAASIGDSTLLVLPPRRKTPGDRRLKKLGYEDSTSVGSGDTTLSTIDESECIEQWWPHKEDGGSSMRVAPGTYLVLLSDGISDNLPAELIDQLVHRYPVDRATFGLPLLTRERRTQTQKRSGGSTQQLGLDNMSAIVVRFDGLRSVGRAAPAADSADASLITVVGTHGGPTPDAGGYFGMACLTNRGAPLAAACVRELVESEHRADIQDRLAAAFSQATSRGDNSDPPPSAVLAVDARGARHAFSSGGVSLAAGSKVPVSIAERTVSAARETRVQRLARTPGVWGPAIAALAIFLVVSTAFATGTVHPAPPPAPPPRPGEPRPTADTRPSLSIGGFVLQPPVQPTSVPVAPAPGSATDSQVGDTDQTAAPAGPGDASAQAGPEDAPVPAVPADQAPPGDSLGQTLPRCTNLLGIGCSQPPPPARPGRRGATPPDQVVPVASPAAIPDESLFELAAATSAPPRGSRLESALQGASAADQNFAREVDPTGR